MEREFIKAGNREIHNIIIHCSDSEWGTRDAIDEWHKQRGWDGIGYHFCITNGVVASCHKYRKEDDGVIQEGRDISIQGAHVKGHNAHSIGICLIGKEKFTGRQLYDALPMLLQLLMTAYKLTPGDVYGHNEYNPNKTCPNFNVDDLRKLLKGDCNVPR